MKSFKEAARIAKGDADLLIKEIPAWNADISGSVECQQLFNIAEAMMGMGLLQQKAAMRLCLVVGMKIGMEMEKP
jgi:hypothetical protein